MNKWSSNQIDVADIWIKGTAQWMNELVSRGWDLYYVNFMFEPFLGPTAEMVPYMQRGIRKFYGRFCTEFVRNGRALSELHRMPKLWLFPDLPVPKHEKKSLREVNINGGLHYNGPLLIPPVSRFQECPIKHFAENQHKYARYGIERIHIMPGGDISDLADYAAKNIKNHRANEADIMLFPRSVTELPERKKPTFDPRERLLKDIQSRFNVCDEIAQKMRDDVVDAERF